jgi:hypothetical protein
MKIDYTEKDARQIERYYFDMVLAMENVGRKCSAREKAAAQSAMFHTLSVCGVKFVSDRKFGGAFRVFAPDGNEFEAESEVSE